MFYGAAGRTSPTAWSSPYTTLPLTAPHPVQGDLRLVYTPERRGGRERPELQFSAPRDDGGSPILGY